MATKREMRAEALALAEKLGVSVDVDRLNADALRRLLAELKEQAASAAVRATPEGELAYSADAGMTWMETVPPSESQTSDKHDPPPPAPSDDPPSPAVRRARALPPSATKSVTGLVSSRKFLRDSAQHAPYVVAAGRTIPSTRGTLYAGQGVRESDFLPGTLEDLVAMGAVLERKQGAQGDASDEPRAKP